MFSYITLNTNANNQLGNSDFTVNFSSTTGSVIPSTMQFHTWGGSIPSGYTRYYSIANGSFLYLSTTTNVGKCSALTNGSIYACANVTTSYPFLAKLGTNVMFDNSNHVYLAYNDESYIETMIKVASCDIDSSTGDFVNSTMSSTTGAPFNTAIGVDGGAIYNNATNNSFMYVVSNGLWVCPLNSGKFTPTSCVKSTAIGTNFTSDGGMVVNNNSLYITRSVSGNNLELDQCIINSDGTISACSNITPKANGKTLSYLSISETNDILIYNNFMYMSSMVDSVTGIAICTMPVNASSNCAFNTGPLAYEWSLSALNGYLYIENNLKTYLNIDGNFGNTTKMFGY